MKLFRIKTILSMEATRFFQNRKQAITTFLLAPIMVFIMIYALSGLSEAESRIEVYGAGAFRDVLAEDMGEVKNIVFNEGAMENLSQVSAQKNIVVITVETEGVRIYYDSSLLSDSELLYTAQELADRIVALQISETQYPTYNETVCAIRSVDISNSDDQIESLLIPLVSMVFIVALMLVNMSVSNLATDTIAGERERGTFDMLRLSGIKTPAIIIGKYGFIVFVSMVMLVAEVVFLTLGLQRYQYELYQAAAAQSVKNPLWFLPVLVCLLDIAVLYAALYIGLSASFEKARQASAYASIAQLVLSLFTYAPNVFGGTALNYLPISNLWIVLQNALDGKSTTAYVVCSTGISLAVASAALCYGAIILEKETKR